MISNLFDRAIDWRRFLPRRLQGGLQDGLTGLRGRFGKFALDDRVIDILPWAAATLLIAGIVHIVSVLLMPAVAPDDAMARLSRHAQGAQTEKGVLLLPSAKPDAPLIPFEDAAFEEAVCLYDLGKSPLRVRAPADGEDFLGLSFHAGAGRIYHSMSDRSAIKGMIDIIIGDATQIEMMRTADDADAPSQDIRLTSPTRRGFVLIRSLAKRESDHARARERLRTVSCEHFELPRE